MAAGNLNYSTHQNTTHTENAELKEELNSELYNRMFEEQEASELTSRGNFISRVLLLCSRRHFNDTGRKQF